MMHQRNMDSFSRQGMQSSLTSLMTLAFFMLSEFPEIRGQANFPLPFPSGAGTCKNVGINIVRVPDDVADNLSPVTSCVTCVRRPDYEVHAIIAEPVNTDIDVFVNSFEQRPKFTLVLTSVTSRTAWHIIAVGALQPAKVILIKGNNQATVDIAYNVREGRNFVSSLAEVNLVSMDAAQQLPQALGNENYFTSFSDAKRTYAVNITVGMSDICALQQGLLTPNEKPKSGLNITGNRGLDIFIIVLSVLAPTVLTGGIVAACVR